MSACAVCGKVFTNKQNLMKHVINTHSDPADCATCDICHGKFKSSLYLNKHKKRIHFPKKATTQSSKQTNPPDTVQSKDENLKPYPKFDCSLCNKEFKSSKQLFGHKKTCSIFLSKEDKPYPSTINETKYYNLTTKPKPVETLSSSVPRRKRGRPGSSNLTRPYTCAICDKTFAIKGGIYNHMIQCHLNLPRSPRNRQTCAVCGANVLDMKAHMSVHSSERPFSCDVCESSFKKINHLKTHKLIHIGSKPHVCPVCGKAFSQIGDMYKHAQHVHNFMVPRKRNNTKEENMCFMKESLKKEEIIEECISEEFDPAEIVSTTLVASEDDIEHITLVGETQ
uniref:Zinc finger protein 480 n=1 Tax=Cacopsylla melanoneura TaxID=428564 RepID=A0A8D8YDX3_9HEMI